MTEYVLNEPAPGRAASASAHEGAWGGKTWAAVLSLTATSFALVSAEFLPAGILTVMAADLGITEGTAGQVITATALVGAVTALLSNVLIGRLNRKAVLVGLSAMAIIANLLSAYAPNFTLLLIGRALLGIALSAFWALSVAVVARLVGPKFLGRGVALVALGTSLATIAAPALGAIVADWTDWRTAMALTAALAGIAMVWQLSSLPSLPASTSNSLASVFGLLKRPAVLIAMLSIILLMGGHMTGSVYVRPFLEEVTRLDVNTIAIALAIFGIAAVIGTPIAGRLADINAGRTLALTSGVIFVAGLVLLGFGTGFVGAAIALFIWGVGFGMTPVALQANLSRSTPDALEAAGSLIVTSFQVAITAGAVLGGVIVDGLSPSANMVTLVILSGVSVLLALLQSRR